MVANGPVVWEVAVCVGVGMRFCKVPVSGQDFRVTIKLTRWLSPGKWVGSCHVKIKLSRWRCKNHDN